MKIAHFAPFGPNACGLYEAARDFIRADRLAGRVSELVDVGTATQAARNPPRPGEKDSRGGLEIVARRWEECRDFDLYVFHDLGDAQTWVAQTCTPAVLMVHGRPAACFRPEQWGRTTAYTFVANLAQWPRIRKVVTMWREFLPYWRTVVPIEKLACTDDPPIDCEMYTPNGIERPMLPTQSGEWNVLIADSWRDDIDIFEITAGAICAARQAPKPGFLKFHFYAVENKAGAAIGGWDYLFNELRSLGALGIVSGRVNGDMSEIYRSMDLVVSPHRIAVRVIGEALACGVPVVADIDCRYTRYRAPFQNPEAVAGEIYHAISDLTDNEKHVQAEARDMAVERFSLQSFAAKLGDIYSAALSTSSTQSTATTRS